MIMIFYNNSKLINEGKKWNGVKKMNTNNCTNKVTFFLHTHSYINS